MRQDGDPAQGTAGKFKLYELYSGSVAKPLHLLGQRPAPGSLHRHRTNSKAFYSNNLNSSHKLKTNTGLALQTSPSITQPSQAIAGRLLAAGFRGSNEQG